MHLEPTILSLAEMDRAFQARDASFDGLFVFAVQTTGIFCRPSCPSRPKRENVEFFPSSGAALAAGYRPCKRCAPLSSAGAVPDWVAELQRQVEAAPEAKWSGDELRALGITPERARRWFLSQHGMSFAAWCRGRRLAHAFTELQEGAPLDEVILGHGYESHSGFRSGFAKAFGQTPGGSRGGECIFTALIESPLGPIVTGATGQGICLLDFVDRRKLEANYAALRTAYRCAVVPGSHSHLTTLHEELARYFRGELREFSVPLDARGTSFQERVWGELRRITPGTTISYATLAERIGHPRAVRAVAGANGANRICILIPCHRVIGQDGQLSGYGGGVWRKRLLLQWEADPLKPATPAAD